MGRSPRGRGIGSIPCSRIGDRGAGRGGKVATGGTGQRGLEAPCPGAAPPLLPPSPSACCSPSPRPVRPPPAPSTGLPSLSMLASLRPPPSLLRPRAPSGHSRTSLSWAPSIIPSPAPLPSLNLIQSPTQTQGPPSVALQAPVEPGSVSLGQREGEVGCWGHTALASPGPQRPSASPAPTTVPRLPPLNPSPRLDFAHLLSKWKDERSCG